MFASVTTSVAAVAPDDTVKDCIVASPVASAETVAAVISKDASDCAAFQVVYEGSVFN